MARYEFKLPDIGEGVTEGEVVTWHVQEGDHVTEDQLMVEVMTDKATVTIGAPRAGRIAGLQAEVGAVVQVGQVLVVLESGNGSRASGGHPAKMPASVAGDIEESLPGASYFGTRRAAERRDTVPSPAPAARPSLSAAGGAAGGAAVTSDPPAPRSKPLATPAVRRLARELGVELDRVPASGPAGRLMRADVERFAAQGPLADQPATRDIGPEPGAAQRIPFVGLRRKIAERMRRSKDTAAHFTFVEECDATQLLSLRERLKDEVGREGAQLNFLPFVIKAVIAGLRRHPLLNSWLDVERNEIVVPETYNIGVAVASEQGLVVPVIHHAEQRSLKELASEVDRLSLAARNGQLTVAELSGSTFTLTSLGKQSGLFAVPIINQPNVGILGIHRIKERPVVRHGRIEIGHIMLLSLSLDHRIIDGHQGAAFAYEVIHFLEDPARLLLDA